MNAEMILMRLEGVRQRSAGQWSALCPAHDDKSPSLSVKEATDGRVLMHCYGGCHVRAVLDALGLDMEALFPPKPDSGPMQPRRLLTPSHAMDLIERELYIIAEAAGKMSRGSRLNAEQRERLGRSSSRVMHLISESAR